MGVTKTFHVNPETGDYGECRATVGVCTFAGENATADHYTDKEEAIYHSEKILAENLGLFKKEVKTVLPTINENYSFPQADRLDRLAETVDSVNLGSNNSKRLSESLSVVDRQGLYYADAAAYLGLVSHSKSSNGQKVYSLTDSGKSFADGDKKQRDKILRHAISEIPAVKVYREKGETAARDFILSTDSASSETVERKMTTVRGWAAKLNFNDDVVNYDNELSERSFGSQKPKEVLGELCDGCFMRKPLTGICDNCD